VVHGTKTSRNVMEEDDDVDDKDDYDDDHNYDDDDTIKWP